MAPRRCGLHVETGAQATAAVATGVAFFVSFLVLMKLQSLDDTQTEAIKLASNASNQNHLILKTQCTAGLVFAATIVGFEGAIGFIAFIGRISNTKYSKTQRRIFTCLYLVIVSVCLLSFFVATIVGIFTSVEWSDILSKPNPRTIIDSVNLATEVETVRNSVAAISAFSILAVFLFGSLDVFMIHSSVVVKHHGAHVLL